VNEYAAFMERWQGNPEAVGEKRAPFSLVSTNNHTRTDLRSNLTPRDREPAK